MTAPPGERLYRMLLRMYPAEFRRLYEEEMLAFYRERRGAAGTGVSARCRLWIRLLSDVLATAGAQHAGAVTARFNRPRRRERFMDTLLQDLRLAFKGLTRAPAFTAVVLTTLALGIGANTAIFSVVNAVLLKPLPYSQADRIEVIWHRIGSGLTYNAESPPEYFDLKEQSRTLDVVAAIRPQTSTILGDGGEPERLPAYVVTPEFFDMLGASPAMGRGFRADDGQEGAEKVIVISNALWRRRFGGDPAILSRQVNVGGFIRTIVGVMPPGVAFPDAPVGFLRERGDLWIPSNYQSLRGDGRGNQFISVLARRREGVTTAQARADLELVSARLRAQFPDRYGEKAVKGWKFTTVPLRDQMVGAVRPVLLVLAGAVGLVLLIACVNTANLLLARGALRQREVAVRLALGADRPRLLRQMLTESTTLSLVGGGLGVLLASVSVPLLLHLDRGNIPRIEGTRVSGVVLGFSLGVSLLTGLLVGIVPALQHSRTDLRSALGEGARGASDGRGRRRLRSALVAAQIAMALVILVAAGLLGRSFAALQTVQPGLDPRGVLSIDLTLPRVKYDSSAKIIAFYDRLVAEASRIPGATAVSAIYPLPLGGDGWSGSIEVEGLLQHPGDPEPHAEYSVAMPGYFRTLGVPLRAGREFTSADTKAAPLVAIIDERLARKYWPGQNPIGKRFRGGDDWTTVVGVAGHVHRNGPAEEGEGQIYMPLAQYTQRGMSIVVHTDGKPSALASSLRQAVKAVDPDLPTAQIRTMDELMVQATSRPRFNLLMLAVFALVALGLASIGLYGVMSYLVAQRTREIGIRIALGGQPGHVRRMVVRESLLISVAGLAIGGAISLALSRVVAGLLFGVRATDPPTYIGIVLLLLVVSAGASYGPARRATRVDPLTALHE
ncbi:MAG TPA: ABC transporter permease [Gemmatimonadales bacterium]|nr:ABC transporter permease [Gemmatimonadales bacterium]